MHSSCRAKYTARCLVKCRDGRFQATSWQVRPALKAPRISASGLMPVRPRCLTDPWLVNLLRLHNAAVQGQSAQMANWSDIDRLWDWVSLHASTGAGRSINSQPGAAWGCQSTSAALSFQRSASGERPLRSGRVEGCLWSLAFVRAHHYTECSFA